VRWPSTKQSLVEALALGTLKPAEGSGVNAGQGLPDTLIDMQAQGPCFSYASSSDADTCMS